MVVYHGTRNGGFTIFDTRHTRNYKFGENNAMFFSDSRLMAKSYGKGDNKKVIYNWKRKTQKEIDNYYFKTNAKIKKSTLIILWYLEKTVQMATMVYMI